MALQAPSLIASLPRPLAASDRKCQFAEVYGLDGSKKRKRYEIVAAIDGEAVNIYNVHFPKLVTSYALPPQSSFQCPPLSLRQKASSKSTHTRRTYCAVDGPEKELKCFVEESETGSRNATTISTSSFSIEDTDSPAVFIGAVPTVSQGNKESFDVICVHRDGRVRRLAPDLKTQKWSMSALGRNIPSGQEVQVGFLLGFEEARKSLFRKRQDIVAMILGDRISVNSENSSVLMLVTYPARTKTIALKDVHVHLFSVPAHVSDSFALSETQKMRQLLTVNLPTYQGRELLISDHFNWSAAGTGELCLSFDAGFINYDLSQYSPTVTSHLILDNERFSSLLRISPRTVITASQTSITVYNTQYRSVQNELSFKEAMSVVPDTLEPSNPSFEFVAYYSKLGVAIAAYGFQLFAFDLDPVRGHDVAHRKPHGNLLIDAIGKGVGSADSGAQRPVVDPNSIDFMQPLGHTRREDAERWTETKSELDAAVRSQDTAKFDSIVKARFGKPSAGEDGKAKKFPSPKDFIDIEKIYYLLSAIFSVETVGQGPTAQQRLVISFCPNETFHWLISTGRLTFNNIQAALRKAAIPRVLPSLPRSALVEALVTHRRGSIKLLLQVLRSPVQLNSVELATALEIILNNARSHANESDQVPKTLTETPHKHDDSTVEAPRDTAEEPAHEPGSAVTNAITGLNLTLIRLHSLPSDQVSKAIRSVLSNSDVLSIINHLRHALATGGYTSRYTEDLPPVIGIQQKIPRLPLPAIVDLLNACIDAIGPSGWISAAGFASGQGSEATLIADLKSEISAVLAGVEEATYLKGILREFIRCCETAATAVTAGPGPQAAKINDRSDASSAVVHHQQQQQQSAIPQRAGIKRKERHNGAEIEIYEHFDDASGFPNDTRLLPLSLKLVGDQGIREADKKKLLSTGEMRTRSAREVSYLKRKAVGKYSFERIIL
ncbi:hypothetical protein VTO42DRAFT_3138 [Malbranchea cinnamomea]